MLSKPIQNLKPNSKFIAEVTRCETNSELFSQGVREGMLLKCEKLPSGNICIKSPLDTGPKELLLFENYQSGSWKLKLNKTVKRKAKARV